MIVIYRALDDSRRYTFADVKSNAQAFGEALRERWRWRRGDVLSVIATNDADYGVCVYGALYAGGVVAPANPDYSASDLAHMLVDAGAKAVITQEPLVPMVREACNIAGLPHSRIILMGTSAGRQDSVMHFLDLAQQAPHPYKGKKRLDPDKDLAFLAYSSGTTGLPKGVMLSHSNIISDVLMVRNSVGGSYSWRQDKILGVLPFYHIYGEHSMWSQRQRLVLPLIYDL